MKTTLGRLQVLLAVVAGVWTLVHMILTLGGNTSAAASDGWGTALVILVILSIAVALGQYTGERKQLSEIGKGEEFPEPAISRFFVGSSGASELWFTVRMYVGAEWFLAGWDKVTSAAWGTSGTALGGFVKGALAKTGGANPSVQSWYAWFLQHIVQPNLGFVSFVVTWGETAVGVGILLGALTGIAAGFGILMNFNYLLSGTVSINPILGVAGLFLVIAWRVAGWMGADRLLLPALGMPWKPGVIFHRHSGHPRLTPSMR